jgi:hypothetical protein
VATPFGEKHYFVALVHELTASVGRLPSFSKEDMTPEPGTTTAAFRMVKTHNFSHRKILQYVTAQTHGPDQTTIVSQPFANYYTIRTKSLQLCNNYFHEQMIF